MNPEELLGLYDKVGEEAFTAFTAAFYRRVKTDDILGPMYPADDWEGAEKRLRDFLIYRFGGPERYIKERGHPRLGMRHMHFPIGPDARDRWVELMRDSLDEVGLPEDVKQPFLAFFSHVANFLQNRPE